MRKSISGNKEQIRAEVFASAFKIKG